ncbi:MAG: zinc ribbon domain-containing protein [Bacteroidaceae bacterium]|nr:zinc ribbon domain-containing protein [Bacteroidaceae bacterium]
MNYCPNCGAQLTSGMSYCPKCGNTITIQTPMHRSQSNKKLVTSSSVSGALLSLCVILNAATFFCIGVVAYDTKEILWINQLEGTCKTGGGELHNCLIGSVFTSMLTSILLIIIGLNKLSKAGNYVMMSCGILTFCVAIYAQFQGLYACAQIYNCLLWCWMGCTMIYLWTSLYKGVCSCSKNQAATPATLICIVLSLIYIVWFGYTAFSHSGVLR